MKIGILGAGNVGGTLGRIWQRAGHDVAFGRRKAEAGEVSLSEAFAHGELLLLATPWIGAREFLEGLGDFNGRVLMDATNPILPDFSGLEYGTTTSGGEQVAAWARHARVVKAFNTVGFNVMAEPAFDEGKPTMFYCGDDAGAKAQCRELVDAAGFDAVDAGPLRQARYLEPVAMLWITMAIQHGYGREMALRLMRR